MPTHLRRDCRSKYAMHVAFSNAECPLTRGGDCTSIYVVLLLPTPSAYSLAAWFLQQVCNLASSSTERLLTRGIVSAACASSCFFQCQICLDRQCDFCRVFVILLLPTLAWFLQQVCRLTSSNTECLLIRGVVSAACASSCFF